MASRHAYTTQKQCPYLVIDQIPYAKPSKQPQPLFPWHSATSLVNMVQVSCSTSGLCIGSKPLALTKTMAPVLTLVNSTYLSPLVTVKQGYSYAACPITQQPTSGSLHILSLLMSSANTCAVHVLTLRPWYFVNLYIYPISAWPEDCKAARVTPQTYKVFQGALIAQHAWR